MKLHTTLLWTLLALCAMAVPLHADPVEYGFTVVDKKPLARDLFSQGLEIVDGDLYFSSGGYWKSKLQRYDFASGSLEAEHKLDRRMFAEGLTILGDRLYQLTWQNRLGLIYQLNTLEPVASWRLPGEGWGLTNNGSELIYSDGSHQLHFVDPGDGRRLRSISVTDSGMPVRYLNELEWVDGKVWANVWQSDLILIIDPASGEVTGRIDLRGLLPAPERRSDTDVLNGIARDPATGAIWVTGKRWPWLYHIELVEKKPEGTATPQ